MATAASHQLAFWMGLPPTLRAQTDLLNEFVDDLLAFMRPFGTNTAHSSEPRWYRLTKRGRAALHVAIANKRVELLMLGGGDDREPTLGAVRSSVILNLGVGRSPGMALDLQGTFDTIPEAQRTAVRANTAAFVRRWFAPSEAASAWVSDQLGDSPLRTLHEERYHLVGLAYWPAQQHYGRGAFWGTGLGPDLCRRLGGVDRVLAAAPVAIAEPLGDGVWLQLGATIPAAPAEMARLRDFLAPILFWTPDDLHVLRPLVPVEEEPTLPRPDSAPPLETAHIRVPVHVLAYDVTIYPGHPGAPTLLEEAVLERDLSFNVHLEARPTRAQQRALLAAVEAWAADVEAQSPGGPGFRHRYIPTLDVAGRTLRLHVEAGELGSFEITHRLLRWLAAVPTVRVHQILVGTEETG